MKKRKKEFRRLRGDSGQQRRIFAIAVLLGLVAFTPVACRLFQLMVLEYEYYSELALRNQSRTTQVTADRGTIFDRNMNILAQSVSVENIYLNPYELKYSKVDLDTLSENLGRILNKNPAWIKQKAENLSMRYQQVGVRVDAATAAQVRDYLNSNQISGVHLEPSSQRQYPYGSLAAQVIGFTNASNTGSEGIEAAYNAYLEGKSGGVLTTKGSNEMDMPFSYEGFLDTQEGCSVVLTLDATVQQCLEKQMQAAIDRYSVQNGAFGMVMNAKTGEILAMATLGSYDPNQYLEIYDPEISAQLEQLRLSYMMENPSGDAYGAAKQAYEQAKREAQLKQWRNRCLSDGYEPGSTFKVLTMAAALDCGAIDLNTSFHCSGSEQIPGRSQRLHCWRSTGHGAEQTPQALQNSCNIAFAHIALKLGGERFYDYIDRFGILDKTGIDLAGESKGVFFDKAIVTDTDKWGTASLTSASFGQTFKLTPLQLVRAISSVVNGGYLMEPYCVSEVLDAQGNTVLKQEPTVIRQVIRPETSRTMCELIRSVVTEGTAKNAQVAGFDIGGKTGTSEKIDVFDENGKPVLDKIVSFVGIAPMDDPEYIVLVALDTPSRSTGMYISGGVMAAPTVGAVMADILPYLEVRKEETLVAVPDLTGLTAKEAQLFLKKQNIIALMEGKEETVTFQLPAPGQNMPEGSQMFLYFGQDPETTVTTVPDFKGMNRLQATQAAGAAGLLLQFTGNGSADPDVTVTAQSIPKDTTVPMGTTVTLEFTDTKAAD